MTGRHIGVSAVLALLAAATAGCSGDATGGSPDPPASSASSSSSPPSTSPAPTPEEEAAASALDALVAYWDVQERSSQAPAERDWEPELRRYSDEALASANLSAIQRFLDSGIVQVGTKGLGEPEVTSVDLAATPQPMVTIMACLDPTTSETIYVETGEPTPDPPPELTPKYPQWPLQVTVLQYLDREGTPWLVHTFDGLTEQQC